MNRVGVAHDDRVVTVGRQAAAAAGEGDRSAIGQQVLGAEIDVVGCACGLLVGQRVGVDRADDRAVGGLVRRRTMAGLDGDVAARRHGGRGAHVQVHDTLGDRLGGQAAHIDQGAALRRGARIRIGVQGRGGIDVAGHVDIRRRGREVQCQPGEQVVGGRQRALVVECPCDHVATGNGHRTTRDGRHGAFGHRTHLGQDVQVVGRRGRAVSDIPIEVDGGGAISRRLHVAGRDCGDAGCDARQRCEGRVGMLAAEVDTAGAARGQRGVGADLDQHGRIGVHVHVGNPHADKADRDVVGRADRALAGGAAVLLSQEAFVGQRRRVVVVEVGGKVDVAGIG